MMKIKTLKTLKLVFLLPSVVLLLCSPALGQVKKVALFPLAFHGDASEEYLRGGVMSMLASRLEDQNIGIVAEKTMNSVIEEKHADGISSAGEAKAMAGRIGADYAVFGSITALGDDCSIDLGVLDLDQEKPRPKRLSVTASRNKLIAGVEDLAVRTKAVIRGKSVAAAPQKKTTGGESSEKPYKKESLGGIFFKPQESPVMIKPSGSLKLDMAVMAFDTADLDGDAMMELVVLSRKQVRIYTRKKDGFELRDTMKPSFGRSFIHVSVGDADGNGKQEICVVDTNERTAASSVWEWSAGEFKRLYEIDGHLRITRAGKNENQLMLFQESLQGGEGFFSGDIIVMGFDGQGNPVKEKALMFPEGTQFYTVIFNDTNRDGETETLFLGRINARQRGRLHLGNEEGKSLWRSIKAFGGTNNVVETNYVDSDSDEHRIPLNTAPAVIYGKYGGEVLAVENHAALDFITVKRYSTSSLSVYQVQGKRLAQMGTSEENQYPVADMHVYEGTLFIATHDLPTTNFGKGFGQILWF